MGSLALQICSCLIWFPLEVLTINAIRRCGVRNYPLILAYMVVTFLLALVEVPVAIAYHLSNRAEGEWLQLLHSVGEFVTYVLILAVVVSFIYRTTSRLGPRRLVRFALIAGCLSFIGISFLIHYDRKRNLGNWMAPWTRDLEFGAAILDLALWALLLASRNKDSRLLLLAGGMGIMFAGEAVGESVRTLAIQTRSYAVFMAGNVIMTLADCSFLYVWWQTFKKEAAGRPPGTPKDTRSAVCSD
jgi:hypothetical protein